MGSLTIPSSSIDGILGGPPPSSGGMTLINTGGTTLSGSSTTISSIPSTYKDLVLYVYKSLPATDAVGNLYLRFNGDSSSLYTYSGSNQIYRQSWNDTRIDIGVEANNSSSNGLSHILIPQYKDTTIWKMIWGKSMTTSYSSGNVTMENKVGIYGSTSAISSITFLPYSGNFTSGTAYLYGVS